jgi:hypothetical protein
MCKVAIAALLTVLFTVFINHSRKERLNKMSKLAIVALVTALFSVAVPAQKQPKPWGEWSQKDAQKILDDSPWGQTQTETDTSQMFYSPTNDPNVSGRSSNDSSRLRQGATNQAVNLNFRVRFFSAKPIRQALVRLMEIKQKDLPKETIDRLNVFANLRSDEWIIVAVAFDSNDQRYSGPVMQAFGSVTTDLAKNDTYLERKDGKRLYLNEYVAPGKDGFGARFIFPRQVEGQPFLTADAGEVRFHSEFSAGSRSLKLDRRFKTAEMVYNGELEY